MTHSTHYFCVVLNHLGSQMPTMKTLVVGENAAYKWMHRCNHTEGMRQQYLGPVSFSCRPDASDRGHEATFLQSFECPCVWSFSRHCGLLQEFTIQKWECCTAQGMPSDHLWTSLVGMWCSAHQWPAQRWRPPSQDVSSIQTTCPTQLSYSFKMSTSMPGKSALCSNSVSEALPFQRCPQSCKGSGGETVQVFSAACYIVSKSHSHRARKKWQLPYALIKFSA